MTPSQLALIPVTPSLPGVSCPCDVTARRGIAAAAPAFAPPCSASVWPADTYTVSQGPGLPSVDVAGPWRRCARGHQWRADGVRTKAQRKGRRQ